MYKSGIVEIEKIPDDYPLSKQQQFQVTAYKENKSFLEKEALKTFMSTFQFPLYFLDFETFQQAIPMFDGVKPYQQIPFQYSLHILDNENAEIAHKDFLGVQGEDPRRALAEQIVQDIPHNVCTVAYNMSFEKKVLRDLAEQFPDLAEHLLNIHDHMVDLMIPFQKKWIYLNEMKGSYSIKYVLPALFPHDEELNYQNLEIQNGSMAMSVYENLHLQPHTVIERIRAELLAYCRLDTMAMVRIWEWLKELINS